MRPVNLIPREERHGETAPLRTGPAPYAIVGVLAFVLVGVTVLVLTGNKIADRKSEITSLKSQVAAASAQAEELSAYTNFASMQQAREQTVSSLAQSRFDWERVLSELAIVIPDDVWLTNVSASASADAQTSSTSSSTLGADEITGPSLDVQGCARGHEGVAKFLAALRDVDGVTRVSVMSSDRPGASGGDAAAASSSSASESSAACSTYDFISTFEVVVAFDGVEAAAPSAAPLTSDSEAAQPTSEQAPDSGSDTQSSQSGDATTAVVSGTGGTP